MQAKLYPLAASKILKHCGIFLSTMKAMANDELVELAFNEFVASADRTLQYLQKELNQIGGGAPIWFRNKRDNLPNKSLFYELRHIIAHHFFIPLTPIILIKNEVPPKNIQVNEYRLDIEMLPKDKRFDKKRKSFIGGLGPSVDAVALCEVFNKDLSALIQEAEKQYGNFKYYKRIKVKSMFRVNPDLTLCHNEKQF